jgi:hypothetical protein
MRLPILMIAAALASGTLLVLGQYPPPASLPRRNWTAWSRAHRALSRPAADPDARRRDVPRPDPRRRSLG